MFDFAPGNTVLHRLHPVTLIAYLGAVISGALLLSHPLLLFSILLAVLSALFCSGGASEWKASLKFLSIMLLMLLLINNLANNLGETIWWSSSNVPLLGRVNFTWEVMIYSLVMSVRLLIVFTAFLFFNRVMHPDRALSLFSGAFPRSTLLMALATKSIPHLSQRLQRAAEIQQCRGINYSSGSMLQRIKNRLPLLKVVLLSSLEDSFNVGESIQARAYGSGPRTRYARYIIRPVDILVLAGVLISIVGIGWTFGNGWGHLSFFPSLDGDLFSPELLKVACLMAICLLFPAILCLGGSKWN